MLNKLNPHINAVGLAAVTLAALPTVTAENPPKNSNDNLLNTIYALATVAVTITGLGLFACFITCLHKRDKHNLSKTPTKAPTPTEPTNHTPANINNV